jgi:hypothetical protein
MEALAWCWEMGGGGPHAYLLFEFLETQPQLEQLVGPLLAQDYKRHDNSFAWEHKSSREWGYTTVEIKESQIIITRGWGHPADEEFTRNLLLSSLPELIRWRALAGGDGYASKFFRSGTDIASFSDYCRAEPKEPNFPEVLEQLKCSLVENDLDEKYTLSEPLYEHIEQPCDDSAGSKRSKRRRAKRHIETPGYGWKFMTVPVLYDVPFADGAWQGQPAGIELELIAREVSDRCDVPAIASSTSLHAPDDYHKLIGGQIKFGGLIRVPTHP